MIRTGALPWALLALLALGPAGGARAGDMSPAQRRAAQDVRQLLFGQALVREARRFLGTPYAWGGDTPAGGFDCSGFTQYVYGRLGVKLPRRAFDQFQRGQEIEKPALQPGDLVFFLSPSPQASLHVGIYEGGGLFLHAPGRGRRIGEARLDDPFFSARYMGARRWLAP